MKLYRWHRYMGLSVAGAVLLLTVTGILLNHTEDLQLDEHYVERPFILDWYGIEAPQISHSYCGADHCISQMGSSLYFDARRLDGQVQHLIGTIRLPEILVIAVDDSLLLLSPAGEQIERLGEGDGIPNGIKGVGLSADGSLIVKTMGGTHHRADAQLLEWSPWQKGGDIGVRWSQPTPLPSQLQGSLSSSSRSKTISVERLLLDLHSGRFFGRYGPLIIDSSAIVLVLLALTGFRMWWRHARRRPRKKTA